MSDTGSVLAWPDRNSIWAVGSSENVPRSLRTREFIWNMGSMRELPILPASTD